MVTATEERIAQSKDPLFGQLDLRCVREAAGRAGVAHWAAARLGRRLTLAEMQLLALCDALCEMIREDPTGNLILRANPTLPTERQLRLSGEDAA